MNRIFRVIWSEAKQVWLVVAEKVKSSGIPSFVVGSAALMAAVMAGAVPGWALDPSALPTGGQVVSGSAAISQSGANMTINQSTQQMIANWNTFNIGQSASVRFQQPGVTSTALNRISDQNPSQILGSLTANGQIFLLNPSGIIFGKTATVDVGGLVASTMNLSDSDFLANKFLFTGTGTALSAGILNQGTIRAADKGVVALIAPRVVNEGTIEAPKGTVVMASGDQVTLDFAGDGLVNVAVDKGTIDALVDNKGLIKADGGLVIMSAKTENDILATVVNNDGVIEAQTIDNKSGRILLLGDMDHGQTTVSGTLDASAPNGGDGGFIETSAAKVKVADGTKITTAAPQGKTGSWLIDPNDILIDSVANGGDIQGSTIGGALATTYVVLDTEASATSHPGNGDIIVNEAIVQAAPYFSPTTLTLKAYRNIEVNNNISAAPLDAGLGGLNVVLWSNSADVGSGAVAINNATIATKGGHLFIGGGSESPYSWNGLTVPSSSTKGNSVLPNGILLNGATIDTSLLTNGITTSGAGMVYMHGAGAISYVSGLLSGGVPVGGVGIQATGTNSILGGRVDLIGEGGAGGTGTIQGDHGGAGIEVTTGSTLAVVGGDSAVTDAQVTIKGTGGYSYTSAGTDTNDATDGGDSTGGNGGNGIVVNGALSVTSNAANYPSNPALTVSGRGGTGGYTYGGTANGTRNGGAATGGTGGSGIVVDSGDLQVTATAGDVSFNANGGNGGKASGGYGFSGNGGAATGGAGGSGIAVINAGYLKISASNNVQQLKSYGGSGGYAYGGKGSNGSGGAATGGSGGSGIVVDSVVGSKLQLAATAGNVNVYANGGYGGRADGGYGNLDGGIATGGAGGSGIVVSGAGVLEITAETGSVQMNAHGGSGGYASGGSGNSGNGGNATGGSGGSGIVVDSGSLHVTATAGDVNAYAKGGYGGRAYGGYGTLDGGLATGGAGGSGSVVSGAGTLGITAETGSIQLSANGGSGGYAYGGNGNNGNGGTATGGAGGNGIVVTGTDSTMTLSAYSDVTIGTAGGDGGHAINGYYNNNYYGKGYNGDGGAATGGVGGSGIVVDSGSLHVTATAGDVSVYAFGGNGGRADGGYGYSGNGGAATGGAGGSGIAVINAGDLNITASNNVQQLNAYGGSGGYAQGGYGYVNGGDATGGAGGSGIAVDSGILNVTATAGDVSVNAYGGNGGTASGRSVGTTNGAATGGNGGSGLDMQSAGSIAVTSSGANMLTLNKGYAGSYGSDGYALNMLGGSSISSTSALTISGTGDIVQDNIAATGIQAPQLGFDIVGNADLTGGNADLTGGNNQIGTFAFSGDSLNLVNQGAINIGTVDSTTGVNARTGAATIQTVGSNADITLYQSVSGYSGVTLASGAKFINKAGSSAISSTNGRWLVYSQDPTLDTRGGILYDFVEYNKTYNAAPTLASGNGFVYTLAPTVTVDLVGTVSKQYDTTTAATLANGNFSLSGAVNGDQVTFTTGPAEYDNKNVGSGKTVTASVDSLTVVDANGKPVYGYQGSTTASGNVGDITPATVTTTGAVAQNKIYDTTTAATITGAVLQGTLGSDDLGITGGGTFADKNVGNNKNVTAALTLTGSDAGNYQLTEPTALTAGITPATVTTTGAVAQNKIYDTTTAATITGAVLQGTLGSDDLGVTGGGTFADKNVGNNKNVTANLTLTGADAGNYQLTEPTALTADITPATVTTTGAVAQNKIYDTTTAATITGAILQGTLGSDDLGVTGGGTFSDKNIGSNKNVTAALTLTGTDAGNYQLTEPTALTADITPATVTTTGAVAQNKIYDTTTAATITGAVLQGTLGSDDLGITGGGTFADKNVGNNKNVTANLTLTGTDAGNYQLTEPTGLTADILPVQEPVSGSAIQQNVAASIVASNYRINGTQDQSDTGEGSGGTSGPNPNQNMGPGAGSGIFEGFDMGGLIIDHTGYRTEEEMRSSRR